MDLLVVVGMAGSGYQGSGLVYSSRKCDAAFGFLKNVTAFSPKLQACLSLHSLAIIAPPIQEQSLVKSNGVAVIGLD